MQLTTLVYLQYHLVHQIKVYFWLKHDINVNFIEQGTPLQCTRSP